jgi:hypothetical protein
MFVDLGDLTPFEFFRQETSHIDVEIRESAMSKVAIIAAIIGPEKTRSDLLNYLQSISFFKFLFI